MESRALLFVRKANNPQWANKKSKTGEDLSNIPRYALLQHTLPEGREFFNKSSIKSGDPKWLFTTTKVFKEQFKQSVVGHLRKFISEGKSAEISVWFPDFQRRISRLSKRVEKQPNQTAVAARDFARSIAPRNDGFLFQAIDYRKLK